MPTHSNIWISIVKKCGLWGATSTARMSITAERLPLKARAFIGLLTALGLSVLALAVANWESPDLLKYGGFMMVAIFSSGMQLSVPGVTGTLSLTFLFVLFGVIELSGPETVVMGAVLTLVQCYWNQTARPRLTKVLLHVAAMAIAVDAAERIYHSPWLVSSNADLSVRLAVATCALFLLNTAPISVVVRSVKIVRFFPNGASLSSGPYPIIWVERRSRARPV